MWLIECFIAGFIEKILILFKNVYNLFYKIINSILSFNDKNKIDKILSSKEKKEFNLIDEIDNFTTKDIFEFDNEQQQILYRNLLLQYKNTPIKLISLYVDKIFLWDESKLNELLILIGKENR